jgi:hypothetical protein
MRRREFIILTATIFFAIGLSGITAIAEPKSLNEKLVGTWHLVSNIVERQDGTKVEQFGPNPKGILIFAADGHFATVNARADLPKLTSASRNRTTPEENKAVVEGSLAYYGTYSVSDTDNMITVHIDGSTFANQIGTVQKRLITSITSEEMKFTNPAATSGGSIQLVWKRAN